MGEPFPLLRDGCFAVQRFMHGPIDFCELFGREQPILSYQTGPGGKVLLGLSVVLKSKDFSRTWSEIWQRQNAL